MAMTKGGLIVGVNKPHIYFKDAFWHATLNHKGFENRYNIEYLKTASKFTNQLNKDLRFYRVADFKSMTYSIDWRRLNATAPNR